MPVIKQKTSFKVYGKLTLRGVTKEVVLDVTLNKQGKHPFFHKEALGFSATTIIKRSDFEMRGYLPGVSDETKIQIEVEAIASQG
tara:strand:+ start:580 stop:834 length:255 start_codon:yes stop_codon:yes gene_type:complete